MNNAGLPAVGPLLEIDYDVAHRCIETNVFGVLSMCRVVGKLMANQGSGKIVNVGSIVGYAGTHTHLILAYLRKLTFELLQVPRGQVFTPCQKPLSTPCQTSFV